jgi:hypothetical protein
LKLGIVQYCQCQVAEQSRACSSPLFIATLRPLPLSHHFVSPRDQRFNVLLDVCAQVRGESPNLLAPGGVVFFFFGSKLVSSNSGVILLSVRVLEVNSTRINLFLSLSMKRIHIFIIFVLWCPLFTAFLWYEEGRDKSLAPITASVSL